MSEAIERVSTFPSPGWIPWAETAALAFGAAAAGVLFRPADPLFLGAGFFWPVLAPVLAGARYGFAPGAGCALLLNAWLAVCVTRGWTNGVFPGELAAGLLLAGMITGELRDGSDRRAAQAEALATSRLARLDAFARVYHLLRSSHERLERRAGSAGSLRDALGNLRQTLQALPLERNLPGAGQRILAILAQHASVRAATLHLVDAQGRVRPAAATLGEGPTLLSDPLLLEAVREKRLLTLADGATRSDSGTALLAALPLVDVEGTVHAVVAVRDLHFLALQEENLKLLAALGGHLGDLLARAGGVDDPLASFELALRRSIDDRRRYGVPALLATVTVSGAAGERLAAEVVDQLRGLDRAVRVRAERSGSALLVLLPLTDEDGARAWLRRLETVLGPAAAAAPADAGPAVHLHPLTGSERAPELLEPWRGRREADVSANLAPARC